MKILAFCGSLRTDSWNKKLLFQACDYLREQKCEVNYIDLRELGLPLYDEDLETKSGVPEGGLKLSRLMQEADGVAIASPEYNGGPSGALKNAIDWISRVKPLPFNKKPILLLSTSPGWFGGVRGLAIVRTILGNLRALVVPANVIVPHADKNLDDKGQLVDPAHKVMLSSACDDLLHFMRTCAKESDKAK